jgi:hypothetical protein
MLSLPGSWHGGNKLYRQLKLKTKQQAEKMLQRPHLQSALLKLTDVVLRVNTFLYGGVQFKVPDGWRDPKRESGG